MLCYQNVSFIFALEYATNLKTLVMIGDTAGLSERACASGCVNIERDTFASGRPDTCFLISKWAPAAAKADLVTPFAFWPASVCVLLFVF